MSEALARRLEAEGIGDPRVLAAIAALPRDAFVPGELRWEAEEDWALPIGHGQTISQPFVVAYMTERLGLLGAERVLEIGTGSGYQTAVLALLAGEVFSIERVPELAARARALLLDRLALPNVRLRTGDGALGWPEAAPFDRILVTAAAAVVPPALVSQLMPGGRMVVPVGGPEEPQVLRRIDKGASGDTVSVDLLPVRFVPLLAGDGAAP